MEGVMRYLLDLNDLSGTNCMRRLEQMAQMGSKSGASYKLKATTGKFNVNAKMFTKDQIDYIIKTNVDILYLFGYTNHPTEENQTAFFNFEDHDAENVSNYYGFRKINQASTEKVVADKGWKGPAYRINGREGTFPIYPTDKYDYLQAPAKLWADRKLGHT